MELILPREWCHVTTHLTRTLSASAAVFTKYLITHTSYQGSPAGALRLLVDHRTRRAHSTLTVSADCISDFAGALGALRRLRVSRQTLFT